MTAETESDIGAVAVRSPRKIAASEPKIISLLDLMEEYKLHDLVEMLGSLIETRMRFRRDIALSGERGEQLIASEEACQAVSLVLEGAGFMCGNFDADPSLLEQISRFGAALKDGSADRHASVLAARIDMVIHGIENNLASRKFMYMPAEDAPYWGNTALFGKYFVLIFPKKAAFEMLEAGKCFAADRGTACVFHCMRVAEYGLRKLAKQMKVTLTDKGEKHPLEYADWNKVITAIRNKITETRRLPIGPKQERALQFYSDAADHCEYMKDIWRNELAHTRRLYNKAETLAVLSRVRSFMELFKISEKNAQKNSTKKPPALGSSE